MVPRSCCWLVSPQWARCGGAPLPPDHVARLELPSVAQVDGRLAAEPTRWAPDRTRLLIDAAHADGSPVSGRIQVTVYGVPPPLTDGQRIAAPLKLHRATGFRNPGTFDYAAHLAREGIRVVATARAESLTPLDDPSPPWSVRVKRAAIAAMDRALPPASAALLAGLLLGDRTELPRDIDDAFRRAGVYHILAVSGFNVALLAGGVFAALALVRVPRRAVAAIAIPLVAGFALFRALDILKPFPADAAEKLPGGWGIMTDDLVAGIYSLLALGFLQWFFA